MTFPFRFAVPDGTQRAAVRERSPVASGSNAGVEGLRSSVTSGTNKQGPQHHGEHIFIKYHLRYSLTHVNR